MARKQSDYLAALLAEDPPETDARVPPAPPAPERSRGTTLLNRETALARVTRCLVPEFGGWDLR
jgi:ParB family chromosome partitioning protein